MPRLTHTEKHEPSVACDEVDDLIARFSRTISLRAVVETMTFRPHLEAAFDAETAPGRARELRLTMWVGLVCYLLTAAIDAVVVPDLHGLGVGLRLLLCPALILAAVYTPALASVARERVLTLAVLTCTVSLTLIAATSASPYASYALDTVTLATIYANTTHPLRFRYACASTAVSCLGVLLTVQASRTLGPGLAFALDLQAMTGCLFSLVAAFRLERSTRLTFLLQLKQTQRLENIGAEREALSVLSQTDSLTGLGNRVRLERWSAAIFDDPATHGLAVGLLMLDLDFFKSYNDHYGHTGGDVCLRMVSAVIADVVRGPGHLAVRYGGEEFIVCLADVTESAAIEIARRIRTAVVERRLDHATRADGLGIVTVSIGVAHSVVGEGSRLVDVMDAADRALYAAKRKGRNRVEVEFGRLVAAC